MRRMVRDGFMRGSTTWRRVFLVLILLLLLSGCGSVRFETGQTTEEAIESSEVKAREIRANWARLVEISDEDELIKLVKQHIDSTTTRFINIGLQFADEWRNGNHGRSQAVPADEMRKLIQASIERERPILKAWEDNLEYGWQKIQENQSFSQPVRESMSELVDQYYTVYSVMMFPQTSVEVYERKLEETRSETESLSLYVATELNLR